VKVLREERPVKDWVTEVTLAQQNKIINFLLVAYGVLLCATMAIFFLQGFHAGGFSLDTSLLKWLGGATIGEIAGLLTITFNAVFGQKGKAHNNKAKNKSEK
jgi:hypothetical protein